LLDEAVAEALLARFEHRDISAVTRRR